MLADLTTTGTAAVAREVVEAYGDGSGWVMANPVGTGPYRLKEWRRGQKIVLEANPGFRETRLSGKQRSRRRRADGEVQGQAHFRFIGRIDISVIEEANPRLQAFEKADLDYIEVPVDLVANVMEPDNRLKPRFTKAGVVLQRGIIPGITYTWFNMDDPVVGGYSNEKIALRRAIGMAYNVDEEARVIRQGQAEWASQVIPPGVSGHDPKFVGNTRYDPASAKALLDKFGYVDRDGDGWRDLPDGKPLVLKKGTVPSALERQYDELWKRNMTAVGIRIDFVTQKWPDLLKMARAGNLQMWQLGNRGTTTEGYGFLGLLYGPNAGLANLARFRQADYDRAYAGVEAAAGQSGAREADARDVADRRRVRALEDQRLSLRERHGLSVGRGLQAQRVQHPSVAVPRCRHEVPARAGPVMAVVRALLLALCAALSTGAAAQADPAKVLRVVFRAAETGFDPQAVSDLYSNYVNRAIFESPFRYDFRARPHEVVPNTAAALPEHSKDGTQWTIRIRPGIHFADDPVFKGKKRELTAADYAYSWKRIVDPKLRSPSLDLFDGKIVGMDALVAKAKATGKFDYDAPVEGLQVVDRYTLRLKLTHPWWDLVADLTSSVGGRGRARGDRDLWRRQRLRDGQSRSVPARIG